jgi:hypothetical protein
MVHAKTRLVHKALNIEVAQELSHKTRPKPSFPRKAMAIFRINP